MSIDKVAQSISDKLDEQKKVKVKVALFGQPGAGKSSLINKILCREVVADQQDTGPESGGCRRRNR